MGTVEAGLGSVSGDSSEVDSGTGRAFVCGFGIDLVAAQLDIAGLLFPKVERVDQVHEIVAAVDAAGGQDKPVWLMIETPRGFLDLAAVASASPRIEVLVMGTSDLVKELRAEHTPSRSSESASNRRISTSNNRSRGLSSSSKAKLVLRTVSSTALK